MTDETSSSDLVDRLEDELRASSAALADPRGDECLLCYVSRTLSELGCDTTLRWTRRYRDLRAPTATALERRMGQVGGFCDCEIFLNGFEPAVRQPPYDVWTDRRGLLEPESPADQLTVLGPCDGVRRGSTRPCTQWQRLRRGVWR